MTKYLGKTFSVPVGDSKEYRDNWEKAFGKKKPTKADKPKKKATK